MSLLNWEERKEQTEAQHEEATTKGYTMATTFTTAPYRRTHGKDPRGQGSWAFQASTTRCAYERDLQGEVFFSNFGTYTEAKRQAKEHFESGTTVAVLG